MTSVLREPTLWFALLGAALFALWQVVGQEHDPREIVITPALVDAIKAQHVQQAGELPDEDTLDALIADWVEQEALYREALALGMDDHDPILRRRMVQKLTLALDDLAAGPDPTEEELEAWLEGHPDRYPAPATYAFTQVFVDEQPPQVVIAALEAGAEPAGLGTAFRVGAVQPPRSAKSHARVFGTAFAAALPSLEPGQWTAVDSTYGTHLVRIDAVVPEHTATLDEVRAAVERDLRAHRAEAARSQAIDRILARYTVVTP